MRPSQEATERRANKIKITERDKTKGVASVKQIAKNSKRAIRCHPGGGGRRPADGSDDLMIESHSPISWRPPCRHTSPPARPAWLSAPAARGRPSLDQRTNGFSPRSLPECGFFRRAPLCCRGGRRLLPAPRRSLARLEILAGVGMRGGCFQYRELPFMCVFYPPTSVKFAMR